MTERTLEVKKESSDINCDSCGSAKTTYSLSAKRPSLSYHNITSVNMYLCHKCLSWLKAKLNGF
jgi:hypothetical protein